MVSDLTSKMRIGNAGNATKNQKLSQNEIKN